MGIRRDVGVRRGVRHGVTLQWLAITVAALLLLIDTGAEATAAERRAARPLDHHATVYNGDLVGSAFALAPGLAITNAHVVEGLGVGSSLALVATAGGQHRVPGRVIAVSRRMDLAVLAVPEDFLVPVPEGNSRNIAGLAVSAAGVDASSSALPRRALRGEIREPRADVTVFGPGMVVRMPGVRPGFSGGPVLDGRGALVGMIAAIRPGRPVAAAGSGFIPSADRTAPDEALVLRAPELRAEVRRLLGE